MFKSTFAKYMTAFVTVILVSFIILSSVVTTTIRSHVAEKQAEELYKTGSAIAEQFEDLKVADIENHILSGLSASAISVLVNRESDLSRKTSVPYVPTISVSTWAIVCTSAIA